MVTGVELEEHALLGIAVPAATMGGGAPGAGAWYTSGEQNAAQRGAREVNALALGQQLTHMLVITVGVGCLGEREHPLAQFGVEGMSRGVAPIAMDEGSGAIHVVGGPQPLDLPYRDPH